MLRLQFQLFKQAGWLLSRFACFCICLAVIGRPAFASQQKTASQQKSGSAESEPSQPDAAADKQRVLDFETRVENSISRLGSLGDKNLSESSGLATAAATDCFWTVNDSGNPAALYLFLFDSSCQKLAQIKLANATNRDWESLASFTLAGKHWGLVADVGDNQRLKDTHQLYFFRDPTDSIGAIKVNNKFSYKPQDFKELKSVRAMPFEFSYQASSPAKSTSRDATESEPAFIRQDCEAVAVDPTTLDIWFVEKVHLNRDLKVDPGIFVLPMPKSQLAMHTGDLSAAPALIPESAVKSIAQRIGSFPVRYVSGMSFSPDGKKLIIRNYLTAHLFIRPDDKTWRQTVVEQKPMIVALPLQSQGEAICFTADSQSVIVTSEGVRQPIWKVDLRVYFDKFNSQ